MSALEDAPPQDTRRRLVVQADRCQTCGREPLGLRCDVPLTFGYELQLVRGRAQRPPDATAPHPTSPCSDACPLSLCIQGYVKNIAAGLFEDALSHIMAGTALPETVCRVCHRPCEDVCVTRETSDAIRINDLKRFVVTWAAERAERDGRDDEEDGEEDGGGTPEPTVSEARVRVAVVGAGPSGLTAARDLRARGFDVTLFDAAERPGGLLTSVLPAYRLPPEAVQRDIDRVLSSGVVFRGGHALGRDFTLGGLLEDGHEAIYLAIGAHRSRSLDLPRPSSAPKLLAALPFLTSARAEPGRSLLGPVLVIGGGDAAIDSARTALRLGAERVTIACLESRADMPALADQVALAQADGITLRNELKPVRFEERSVVFEVVGREHEVSIEAHLVVAAIGQEPDLGCLSDDGVQLAKTADGLLDADAETGGTSHPRIFAGGDVTAGHRTVTEAMGDAMRAAWAIDRAVRGADVANRRRPPPRPRKRVRGTVLDHERVAPQRSLTEAEARAEAERCLACGLCGNCHACLDVFGCPALQSG